MLKKPEQEAQKFFRIDFPVFISIDANPHIIELSTSWLPESKVLPHDVIEIKVKLTTITLVQKSHVIRVVFIRKPQF